MTLLFRLYYQVLFRKQQHGGKYLVFRPEIRDLALRAQQITLSSLGPSCSLLLSFHTLGKDSSDLLKGCEEPLGSNVVMVVSCDG